MTIRPSSYNRISSCAFGLALLGLLPLMADGVHGSDRLAFIVLVLVGSVVYLAHLRARVSLTGTKLEIIGPFRTAMLDIDGAERMTMVFSYLTHVRNLTSQEVRIEIFRNAGVPQTICSSEYYEISDVVRLYQALKEQIPSRTSVLFSFFSGAEETTDPSKGDEFAMKAKADVEQRIRLITWVGAGLVLFAAIMSIRAASLEMLLFYGITLGLALAAMLATLFRTKRQIIKPSILLGYSGRGES